MVRTVLSLLLLALLAGCTPVGMAAGAGASLGIGAAREGGLEKTASDIKIKALISDKWFKYDLGTFTKLNLTVDDGRVLITGVVQDPDDRVEAVRLAWQVEGVQQVINEIRVAEGDGVPGYVRDQWITTRLRTQITFDREIRSINYSIDTVAGTIYLMGVARNQAELNKVVEVARTIPNVAQVISYVRISPQAQGTGSAPPVSEAGAMAAPADGPVDMTPPPAMQPAAVERESLN